MFETHWPRVWIAFLAGCIAAFQIGKTFASLTLIIDELSLSLVQAGLILSLFSLIAAIAGAGFGLLSDRIGHLRMAITGLAISATGSFAGALVSNIEFLLLSRLLEGFGFILTIVALPSLISRSTGERDRPLAMGLWGAFMPAGIGLSMIITPVLVDWHGWRGLWNDVGIMLLIWGRDPVSRFSSFTHTRKAAIKCRRDCCQCAAPRTATGSHRVRLLLEPVSVANCFSTDHAGHRL